MSKVKWKKGMIKTTYIRNIIEKEGYVLKHIGIAKPYHVTHIPTGLHIASLSSLKAAKKFGEYVVNVLVDTESETEVGKKLTDNCRKNYMAYLAFLRAVDRKKVLSFDDWVKEDKPTY